MNNIREEEYKKLVNDAQNVALAVATTLDKFHTHFGSKIMGLTIATQAYIQLVRNDLILPEEKEKFECVLQQCEIDIDRMVGENLK